MSECGHALIYRICACEKERNDTLRARVERMEKEAVVLDMALALLWETCQELSPQPSGYMVKGSAHRAFCRLMDNYDLVLSAGWDAKERIRLAALTPEKARAEGEG